MIIGTLSVAAIAFMVMRAVRHLESVTAEFTRTAEATRSSLAEAERVTDQLLQIGSGLEEILPPLQRSAKRVEDLSADVMDEVRRPIETTMSVIRGFRAGTRSLVAALNAPAAERCEPLGR